MRDIRAIGPATNSSSGLQVSATAVYPPRPARALLWYDRRRRVTPNPDVVGMGPRRLDIVKNVVGGHDLQAMARSAGRAGRLHVAITVLVSPLRRARAYNSLERPRPRRIKPNLDGVDMGSRRPEIVNDIIRRDPEAMVRSVGRADRLCIAISAFGSACRVGIRVSAYKAQYADTQENQYARIHQYADTQVCGYCSMCILPKAWYPPCDTEY